MRRKRRRETDKERAERLHAEHRFLERLGIELTDNLHEKLVADIKHGKFKFVERQSLRISIFEAVLEGQTVHLVYDRSRKRIVTILFAKEEI